MSDLKAGNSESRPVTPPSQENIDTFTAVQENITRMAENFLKSVEVAQVIADKIYPIVEGLGKATIKAYEIANAMQPMLDFAQQLSVSLAKMIANINLPAYTEEERQQILESHQKWGEYGWSWLPSAPINFFHTPPLSLDDANAKVEQYCSSEEIEKVFEKLRTFNLQKVDLESAIYCYQNKQYKACALLLFGLIEAPLIQKQKSDKPSVGSGAVRRIRGQIDAEEESKIFFTILCCTNLFSCLEKVFENAHDFKVEPFVINRNFVAHGMSTRRIEKRDCIQLFFILQNLLQFLDLLDGKE